MNVPDATMDRVFQLYGRAAFGLHAFETGILCVRVLVHAAEEKKKVISGVPPKEVSFDKATCGQLLKQIESKWPLPTGFREHLSRYVEMRNYLVHHFFRKRNLDILSPEGRSECIAELAFHIAYFDAALHLVDIFRKQICQSLDWPEDELIREFESWLGSQLRQDVRV